MKGMPHHGHEEQNRNRRCSKLSPVDVAFIRHWGERGFRHSVIANAFRIDQSHATNIINRRVWV
jgi:hypothetical protein